MISCSTCSLVSGSLTNNLNCLVISLLKCADPAVNKILFPMVFGPSKPLSPSGKDDENP